jgi:hypothetical protein
MLFSIPFLFLPARHCEVRSNLFKQIEHCKMYNRPKEIASYLAMTGSKLTCHPHFLTKR